MLPAWAGGARPGNRADRRRSSDSSAIPRSSAAPASPGGAPGHPSPPRTATSRTRNSANAENLRFRGARRFRRVRGRRVLVATALTSPRFGHTSLHVLGSFCGEKCIYQQCNEPFACGYVNHLSLSLPHMSPNSEGAEPKSGVLPLTCAEGPFREVKVVWIPKPCERD